MNKEIKDRLDKLENELKESKNEIQSLKSSVSLTIERGIGKLLSRFTKKQIILGSLIVLFSISIIGIAGTITKTYTFSSGEVVSASKFNTNFDTLFTLVNGNLDDSNISGISGSKITSGTVAAARIDNLSASIITSGTLSAERIDNLTFEQIYNDQIILFTTYSADGGANNGNLGGRTGADNLCIANKSFVTNTPCNNVRALISVDANDEIRDMPNNYSISESKKIFDRFNNLITDNFSSLISGGNFKTNIGGHLGVKSSNYWSGSDQYGVLSNNCNAWTSEANSVGSRSFEKDLLKFRVLQPNCAATLNLICVCY